MSDHLPECRYVVFDQQGQIPATVIPRGCICRALRACEQRVLNAARDVVIGCHLRLDSGEILRQGGDWENAIDKACRAIDALRTKP